jgi:hypothetical protein
MSRTCAAAVVTLIVATAGMVVGQATAFSAVPPQVTGPVVTGSASSSSNVLLFALENNTRPVPDGGFFAFDHPNLAGVSVAFGAIDPTAGDIIVGDGGNATSADLGLHGDVKVFRTDGTEIAHFAPYGISWRGAVNVAVVRTAGAATDEVVTGPGPGGGPDVKVWRWTGSEFAEVASWYAYDPNFAGGVYVAGADGKVVTGPGAGGGPDVRVFAPATSTLLAHANADTARFGAACAWVLGTSTTTASTTS